MGEYERGKDAAAVDFSWVPQAAAQRDKDHCAAEPHREKAEIVDRTAGDRDRYQCGDDQYGRDRSACGEQFFLDAVNTMGEPFVDIFHHNCGHPQG